jgi:hypothetical protein
MDLVCGNLCRTRFRMANPWVSMSPPVDEVGVGEPGEWFQRGRRITSAKDHHGTFDSGERQVSDLIRAHGKLAELAVPELDPTAAEQSEPHVLRFLAEPIPTGEVRPWSVEIDSLRSELQLQQIAQDAPVLFDELGVDAGHVDLS